MTMPDRIKITHRPRTMTTPDIRAAVERLIQLDDTCCPHTPDAISGTSPWDDAIADIRAALKAEPEGGEGPTLADVDKLCAEFGFHYDDDQGESLEMLQGMISASLARWGPPSAAAPAPGENLATPPAPEPGGVGELVGWLNQVAQYLVDNGVTGAPHVQGAAILLERQDAELIALRQQPHPTYLDAIRLAQGCHDYSGGHSGTEGDAWHGAIDTVVAVLKRAATKPWDSQLTAVYGVGVEAQSVPVPVAWCRSDEFANSMNRGGSFNGWKDPGAGANKCDMRLYAIPLPAPQAGEVEA